MTSLGGTLADISRTGSDGDWKGVGDVAKAGAGDAAAAVTGGKLVPLTEVTAEVGEGLDGRSESKRVGRVSVMTEMMVERKLSASIVGVISSRSLTGRAFSEVCTAEGSDSAAPRREVSWAFLPEESSPRGQLVTQLDDTQVADLDSGKETSHGREKSINEGQNRNNVKKMNYSRGQ